MDKDGVLKVACCRHCGNLNSSEELFDDIESLPDCIKGASPPPTHIFGAVARGYISETMAAT